MGRGPHYWPVAARFVVAFVALAVVAVVLIEVSVVTYAYGRLGLDGRWAYAMLFACILGSRFNIPIVQVRGNESFEPTLVRAYGMLYVVPGRVRTDTRIVAANVGGAIVPTVLSVYLIVHDSLGWDALIATVAVAVIVHFFARIVTGVGIVVPTLIPPAAAVLVAATIGITAIAALAYVAGTLGTLIGADLFNLRHINDLDAPVISIGGAGTFDGIFVTGILAVLIAAL